MPIKHRRSTLHPQAFVPSTTTMPATTRAASSSSAVTTASVPAAKRARTAKHACPTCGNPQDRTVLCKSCKARGERRWCLGCGVLTTARKVKVEGGWSCGGKACVSKLGERGEVFKTFAREGAISGTLSPDTMGGLAGVRDELRTRVLEVGKKPKGHNGGTERLKANTDLLFCMAEPGRLALRPEA